MISRHVVRGLFVISSLILSSYASAAVPTVNVGIVFDRGGKDDKSFNSAAFKGATEAKEKLGANFKYVEATNDMAYEPALRAFAQKKFDLIIGIGFAQAEAIKKVAAQFPDVNFAIVDSKVDLPNVRSLLFQEHEGSFLVGAIAAGTNKTGKIGFIGGMDIPLIRRFERGYRAGAEYMAKLQKKKIEVVTAYIGSTSSAWNDPPRAKELALSQYNGGADVIFSACGASGNGIFDAAEEKKKFAIGVDSNQNWIKPGLILTSMLKRVDSAVFATIALAIKMRSDSLKDPGMTKHLGGVESFGLANKGIDYAMDQYNAKLIPDALQKTIQQIKMDILSQKIKVPDYYLEKK